MEQKNIILEYLKKEHLAVLSYEHGDQPRSSAIDFSETEDLEIVFVTLADYRKHLDIKENPKVSLVFSGSDNITVQYEGCAEEISKIGFAPYLKYHLQKNPIEAKFSAMLQAKFYKISPKWIRYANYGAKPNEIFELTF